MNWTIKSQRDGYLYKIWRKQTPWMLYNQMRHVHAHNRAGVPSDQPVIIAANHPTAFVDPVMIGRFVYPYLYNMTRGDIFRKYWARRIMNEINMFPVFRTRDGYTEADRNDGVFEFCIEKLINRRALTLFVEGMHHADKRINPLQKGIARIAFPAYAQHNLEDLVIIPIGCSYWYSDRVRDVAFFNVGTPIAIKDYSATYQTSPAAATKRLCDDITTALRSLAFHISDPDDDDLAEYLLELHRSDHPQAAFPHTTYNDLAFRGEKAVLDRLNQLDPAVKTDLGAKCDSYFNDLKKHNLTDGGLMNPQWMARPRILILLIGFVPFLFGWLGHAPVEALAAWVTNNKIKKREFKSSIYMGIEHFGGILWYQTWIILALIVWKPVLIGLALLWPLCGAWSLVWRDLWGDFTAAWRASRHPERTQLMAKRAVIRSIFEA
jgi:glycerol-3-phosphate O-acyltransferase / dihydroxyacetone phosphate acyltransferase